MAMRFGYTWLRTRFPFSSKQLTFALGLMAVPFTMRLERVATAKPIPSAKPVPTKPAPAKLPIALSCPPDARILRLKRFMSHLHCPATSLAQDFVDAADDNQLDWRLLPSISVIESGGGKAARNNNIFGWDNGDQAFPTVRSSIHEIAYKLGRSRLYRNRDSVGKLRIYNPNAGYIESVVSVMNRISPDEPVSPLQKIIRRSNEFVYATE